MARRAQQDEEPVRTRGGLGCIATLVLGVLIVAVFIFFAAGTDFVRSEMESRVSTAMGMDIQIGRSGMELPYTLVLSELRVSGDSEDVFDVDRVALALDRSLTPRLVVSGLTLELKRDDAARWTPRCFEGLGQVQVIRDFGRAVTGLNFRGMIDVQDGVLSWTDRSGRELARVTGLALSQTRVPMRGRTLTQFVVSVESMRTRDASMLSARKFEWLTGPNVDYVELFGDTSLRLKSDRPVRISEETDLP